MLPPRSRTTAVRALVALTLGCTGEIAETGAPAPPEAPPGLVPPPRGAPPSSPGTPAPWRRLTNFEYDATVRDLFPGVDLGAPSALLPPDTVRALFDNEAAAQGMSLAVVEGYLKAAERVSSAATQEMDRLLGCAAASGEDACFERFLDGFGARAFRRPLAAEERARVLAIYRANKTDGGFRFGVEAALQQVLVSPHFLYRIEPAGRLDPFSLAARLSYFLWGTAPDAELAAVAANGRLADDAEVLRQADRLLASPRSRASLQHFHDQLLELPVVPMATRDKALFPEFKEPIARLMHAETVAFLEHIARGPDARTEDLLGASYSFLNRDLAAYYGVRGPAGLAFEKTPVDPARAAGLLGQGAFAVLTSREKHTWPIDRGKFVRIRLMCEHLPDPPVDVPAPPEATGQETMRELLARHATEPGCRGCHQLIDPIGLGLENLDPAGRWRDREAGGRPVDAAGEVVGGEAAGAFRGPAELGRRLLGSARVRGCLGEQLFAYALGREPTAADRCALAAVEEARAGAGGGMRALVRALVTSAPFLGN